MKTYIPTRFLALDNQTITDAQLSDHNPLIKKGILSWNIMMQGRKTPHGFNTAFALVETDEQYQARLAKIVAVLAEIKKHNPDLTIIALQEAPIREQDISVFRHELQKHTILAEFANMFDDPYLVTSWGIMTLVSSTAFTYQRLLSVWDRDLSAFNNRTQTLQIKPRKAAHQFTLDIMNIHMPYRQSHNNPTYVQEMMDRMLYQKLDQGIPYGLVAVGDFNVDPEGLGYGRESTFSFKGSNVHLNNEGKIFSESVDAIIAHPVTALVRQIGLFQVTPPREPKTEELMSIMAPA